MFCRQCGTKLYLNAKFCHDCGAACTPQQLQQTPLPFMPLMWPIFGTMFGNDAATDPSGYGGDYGGYGGYGGC